MIEIPADLSATVHDHGGAEVLLDWLLEHGHLTPEDLQQAERRGKPIVVRQVSDRPDHAATLTGVWMDRYCRWVASGEVLERRLRAAILGALVLGKTEMADAVSVWAEALLQYTDPVLAEIGQRVSLALSGTHQLAIRSSADGENEPGDPDLRLQITTSAPMLPPSRGRKYGPHVGEGGYKRVLWTISRLEFRGDDGDPVYTLTVRLALLDKLGGTP